MDSMQTEKMITLKYTMRSHLQDGTVKHHAEEEMSFIFGVYLQAPTLEKALEGCHVGDKLSFTIPAGEIYGEYDPHLTREEIERAHETQVKKAIGCG